MNNRIKVWTAWGVFVAVALASVIAQFVFPTQRSLVVALMSLAVGSLSLSTGIKQHRAAKGNGVSLPWWKSCLIIGSLLPYCVAGLYITTELAQVTGEDGGTILGAPFDLLTIGLGIYVAYLTLQQSGTNRTPQQPPSDFQRLPPAMQ